MSAPLNPNPKLDLAKEMDKFDSLAPPVAPQSPNQTADELANLSLDPKKKTRRTRHIPAIDQDVEESDEDKNVDVMNLSIDKPTEVPPQVSKEMIPEEQPASETASETSPPERANANDKKRSSGKCLGVTVEKFCATPFCTNNALARRKFCGPCQQKNILQPFTAMKKEMRDLQRMIKWQEKLLGLEEKMQEDAELMEDKLLELRKKADSYGDDPAPKRMRVSETKRAFVDV